MNGCDMIVLIWLPVARCVSSTNTQSNPLKNEGSYFLDFLSMNFINDWNVPTVISADWTSFPPDHMHSVLKNSAYSEKSLYACFTRSIDGTIIRIRLTLQYSLRYLKIIYAIRVFPARVASCDTDFFHCNILYAASYWYGRGSNFRFQDFTISLNCSNVCATGRLKNLISTPSYSIPFSLK